MKFNINGIEYEDYQLSNEQLIELLSSNTLMGSEKTFIKDKIVERFKHRSCKRNGESEDELFARQFSNFVNGKMISAKDVAKKMSRDHRYLVGEMFKVCMEFTKALAEDYSRGYFDTRDEYACETSKKIIEYLNSEDYPI